MSVLCRTGAEALISVLGPRKGERFVREWLRRVSNARVVHSLVLGQSAAERASERDGEEEALTWLEENLAALLASVPEE